METFLVNLIWLLPTRVDSLFEAYELRYDGILSDKTIIELINEYQEKFNKFIKLIKFLGDDIKRFEYFNRLRELSESGLGDEEIKKRLSEMFTSYEQNVINVIEGVKDFITSEEFRRFLGILDTLIRTELD